MSQVKKGVRGGSRYKVARRARQFDAMSTGGERSNARKVLRKEYLRGSSNVLRPVSKRRRTRKRMAKK